MDYKKYRRLSFEGRVELAKKLLTEHVLKILGLYSYKMASQAELKKEMPRSRSAYRGLCDNGTREVLIDKSWNRGYNQLRTLLHEQLEAIMGDKKTFNVKEKNGGNTYQFPHSRIDKIVDEILDDA